MRFGILAVLLCLWLTCDCVMLSINAPLRVVQTDKWSLFSLPMSVISTQFWSVALTVYDRSSQVVLMLRKDGYPELTNDEFTADYLDVSSWQYNLTSHVLFFTPQMLGNAANPYVGVYLYGPRPQATYDVALMSSVSEFCPSGCFGRGSCLGSECNCGAGYAGIDCRIPLLRFISDSLDVSIAPREWRLAAKDGQHSARASVTAKASGAGLDLLLFLSSEKSGQDEFPGNRAYKDSREMKESGAITLTLDMYSSNEDVYIALYNAGSVSTTVTLIASVSDSGSGDSQTSTNLPLIAGIGGFFAIALVGTVIGCLVFTCRRRRMRLAVSHAAVPEVHGIPIEKVDSMFPQRTFQQLSTFKVADTCSVCLERFKNTSLIRMLPCKHLYHTACIDLWFKDNHICCLCKMDCHNFSEETEVETGIVEKQAADVFVTNLDDSMEEGVRDLRSRSLHNYSRRR